MTGIPEIPPPFLMNPLKHHLGYIREYLRNNEVQALSGRHTELIRDLRHLGLSVMDIYTGNLGPGEITADIAGFLKSLSLTGQERFREWAGSSSEDFRIREIRDGSEWVLKYTGNDQRYIHIFPARSSSLSVRVKANTLKSALLYLLFINKDFVSADDLNRARALCRLSPVSDPEVAVSICKMIEILRK